MKRDHLWKRDRKKPNCLVIRPSAWLYTWIFGTPKNKYRVREEWIESSPLEEDLGVLDMSLQSVFTDQKGNHILGCI